MRAMPSALGFGASIADKGSASATTALSSAAGSIGLRTQSITLMRDALYRMCEASNNGKLGAVQAATLLTRSQDLTAAILAIEQLTGAVTAQQLTLTPGSSSSASANLTANQHMLDEARERETEAQTAKVEAETKKTEAQNSYDTAVTNGASATEISQKKALLDSAESDYKLRDQQLKDAIEVREAIEAARDNLQN